MQNNMSFFQGKRQKTLPPRKQRLFLNNIMPGQKSAYSCEWAQEVYKVSQQNPPSSPGINHCNPTEKAKAALLPAIQTSSSHSGSGQRPFQCHPSRTATKGGLEKKSEETGHMQSNLFPIGSSQLQKLSGLRISLASSGIQISRFISLFQVLFPVFSAL